MSPKRKPRRPAVPRVSKRPPGILRTIADATGRSESHISRVVSGERESVTLVAEIEQTTGLSIAEIRRQFAAERARLAEKYATAANRPPVASP